MNPGKEGGMQLGFYSKRGNDGKHTKHCVGVLLNMKSDPMEKPIGRGFLVRNYLESDDEFPKYVQNLHLDQYDGFSLIGVEVRYVLKISIFLTDWKI